MNGELRVSRALLQAVIDADDAATLALILSHTVRGQVSVRDIFALARGPAQHKPNSRGVLLDYGETLLAAADTVMAAAAAAAATAVVGAGAAAAVAANDDVTVVAPVEPETRRRRLDGSSAAMPAALSDALDALLRATYAVDLSRAMSPDIMYSLCMTLMQARGFTDRLPGKDAFGSRVCAVFNLDPRTVAFNGKFPLRPQ